MVRLRTARLRSALCLLWLGACGGSPEQEVPATNTVHLFDIAPELAAVPADRFRGLQLSAGLRELLTSEEVSIQDERIPPAHLVSQFTKGELAVWHASTRFPVLGAERSMPLVIDATAPGNKGGAGGGSPTPQEGTVSIGPAGVDVRVPAGAERPGAFAVSYSTRSLDILEAFTSETPSKAGALARTTDLQLRGEDRRAFLAAVPSELTWKLCVPAEARLEFAFGMRDLHLARVGSAVLVERPAARACTFQVALQPAGREPVVIWERRVEPSEAGRFFEESVDLAAYAGAVVHLACRTLAPAAPGENEKAGPFAFWAEPVVRVRDAAPPPNLVVLLLDTLRADRVGCYGWSAAETPNIDALAARGVRFADAMSAAPWTLPSHASLFSSLYVSEHGLWNPTQRLPEDVVTLAEVLRQRGYETAAFTEGGYVRPEFGFAQGFDSFSAKQMDVAETFRAAEEWMRTASEPFFAFVQTYRIHTPFDPPEEIRARHMRPYGGTLPHDVHVPEHIITPQGQRPMNEEDVRYLSDLYDSEVAYTDAAVGRLLAFLESSGRQGRTCIVLTSDHGEELGEHGHFDHGWSLYQDQLHVPLLIYAPGRFEGGRVVEHTVHGVDLAPTLVELAGARAPEAWSGVALSLEPPDAPRPLAAPFFLRKGGHAAIAMRSGALKYIDYPSGQRPLDPADGGPKLYDLSTDPLEAHNLWPPDDADRWTRAVEAFYRAHSLAEGATARGSGANDFSDTEGLIQDLDQLGYGGGDR